MQMLVTVIRESSEDDLLSSLSMTGKTECGLGQNRLVTMKMCSQRELVT